MGVPPKFKSVDVHLVCWNKGCSSTRHLVCLDGEVEASAQHWFSEVHCVTLLSEPGMNEYMY